jgi:hypothetical protein
MRFLRTACAPSLGLYFALTGKRLGSADVMYAGLATHLAAGASSSAPLVRALAAARPQDWAATLDACGASTATSDPSELASLRAAIDEAFGMDGDAPKQTLAAVAASLQGMRASSDAAAAAFAADTLEALGAGDTEGPSPCPTAVLAAFHGMRLAHALAPPLARGAAGAELARRAEAARAVELLVNGRLAARADFEEGAACAVGRKKWQPPQWAPLSSLEADAAEWSLEGAREDAQRLASEGRLTLQGARDELYLRYS